MKKTTTLKTLVSALALLAGASVRSALAAEDENGITPYDWVTFDDLEAGTVAASASAGNQGSNTAGMTLPAGTAVAVSGTDMAYQFGTTSSTPNFAPSSALRPTTYITRMNLNNGSYSDGRVWGSNGQAYGGVGLCVDGSSGSYTVKLVRHAGGSANSVLHAYSVPTEKESGFHWYAITIDSTGTGCKLYVDGSVVFETATAPFTASQNSMFGWGQLSNAGANQKVPTGLQVSDFRIYTQTLTAEQIKKIAGAGIEAIWGNVGNEKEHGTATVSSGGSYTGFSVDFGSSDNISQPGIEAFGVLRLTQIRLFRRAKYTDAPPATVTVSQDGTGSVVSKSVTLTTGVKVYGAGWPANTKDYYSTDAFDAVFDSTVTFDTSKPITISFPSAQLMMIQPANSVMQSGGWSPAIEIGGLYAESSDPREFTATLNGTNRWSELVWTPELPHKLYSRDKMTITVTGENPTLLMDQVFSTGATMIFAGKAAVVGADDSLYENGCWVKDILKATSITAEDGISFPAVKDGFIGEYSKSASAITLRAQNREVISVNVAGGRGNGEQNGGGYVVSGTSLVGLAPVPGSSWNNVRYQWNSGATKTINAGAVNVYDGTSTSVRGTLSVQVKAKNTYDDGKDSSPVLHGYLDDGIYDGDNALVQINNIPYSSYDVIVYASTDSSSTFRSVSVNGISYTCGADGVGYLGAANWGSAGGLTPVYGKNAILVRGQNTANLVISGAANGNGGRGCISAVQVVCTGNIEESHDFTATISESTNFGDIEWNEGPFKEGVLTTATITIDDTKTGEVTLTFDKPSVVMKSLSVISKRDLRLAAAATLSGIGNVDVSRCFGKITYAYPVTSLASSDANAAYAGGTADGATVAISHNGGHLDLIGGSYNLRESANDIATTVRINDSEVAYSDLMSLGTATYLIGGTSSVSTPRLILSQHATGRTSDLTVKDNASLTVTGSKNEDTNQSAIMFGHYDGPSTFTLTGNASFTASGAQVLVGKTGNTQTINVNGGVFTALGIMASASATGANTLNLSGGKLMLGSAGIGSYAKTKIAVNVLNDTTIAASAAMKITQPISVSAGKTLTLDATAGAITVSGELTNAGTIRVIGGEVSLLLSGEPGNIVTESGGSVKYGYTVTINNCGKFKIPAGQTWSTLKLYDEKGEEVAITGHDDTYVYFTWVIDGKECWWDYEFDGNGNNTGTEGTALSWDGGRPFAGNEYTDAGELRIPSRPWRDVSSWPEVATFVMYGTMVGTDKTYQLGFGSTYKGSMYTVFLATDSVDEGTVNLCLAYKENAPTVLCSMKVPNAQKAKHLYAFVLKTVGGKVSVNTYLDGELLEPYTYGSALTLGAGFQIGSGHGGLAAGYNMATADDEAVLDFLRVYDRELSDEAMAKYANEYPYVSPKGLAERTFDGAASATWHEQKKWSQTSGTLKLTVDEPYADTVVNIDASTASEVTMNLGAAVSYEQLRLLDGAPITMRTGAGSVAPSVTGTTVIDCNLTVDYDAITFRNVKVQAGRRLTFDFHSLDLADYWSDTDIELTHVTTLGADAVIDGINIIPSKGRSAAVVRNDSGYYVLRIVIDEPLTAEVNGTVQFGDLIWKMGEEVVENPDWSRIGKAFLKLKSNSELTFESGIENPITKLVFTNDFTVSLSKDSTADVSGFSYDFSGTAGKATFNFNPDPTKVTAGYVRYNVDMGAYNYDKVLPTPGGRYEFAKVIISGNGYDYHDRTIIVQNGDYLGLTDGSNLACGLSLDVRGGEVHLGTLAGYASISYGRNGTRFHQSGGTVTVHATGTAEGDAKNGFVLAHTSDGGGCEEFRITGGVFKVPDSFLNFNEAANTIEVSGTGVLQVKGVRSAKKTSSGVIVASAGGALEIGTLGAPVGSMASFALDGGVLRGYEDGATFANPVQLRSDSFVAAGLGQTFTVNAVLGESVRAKLTVGALATDSGTVVLKAANSYSGGTDIVVGTARIGNLRCFGGGGVNVLGGASLDYGGFDPSVAITVSGVGVDGKGALVNNGGEMSGAGASTITFGGETTIGGTNTIVYGVGTRLVWGGNLVRLVNGAKLVANGPTVTGDGRLSLDMGTLVIGGESFDLGGIDLTVAGNGMLDLSGSGRLACHDFKSTGTIAGSGVTLSVGGTLDATYSVTVGRLELPAGSVLKDTGLKVTDKLTLTSPLTVTVSALTSTVDIATVPDDTSIDGIAVVINGDHSYTLVRTGNKLSATTQGGGVIAELTIDATQPWTDLGELKVIGKIRDFQGKATGTGATNINIVVTAGDGSAVTQKFAYVGGTVYTNLVTGLEQGAIYDVSAFLTIDGERWLDVRSDTVESVMARKSTTWIDENADTFEADRAIHKHWTYPPDLAKKSVWNNRSVIAFNGTDWADFIHFAPEAPEGGFEKCMMRDIRFKAVFDMPGLYESEGQVDVTNGCQTAITVFEADDGRLSFAVSDARKWRAVPPEVFSPELNSEYELLMRLDYAAGEVRYGVETPAGVVELAVCPFSPPSDETFKLLFAGSGALETMVGECYDANLVKVGEKEYLTFAEALKVAGESSITPLWWSRYAFVDDHGKFTLIDPNGYLALDFAKWYHVQKASGQTADSFVYMYQADNNWLSYSDVSGLWQEGTTYHVTKPEGLAWLAEKAAMGGTFTGSVMLDGDLDLSKFNWTPIRQFSGTLDGNGKAIVGLNNTNVVINTDMALRLAYEGGVTDDNGYVSYGLVGASTNAAFRALALTGVAISNTADSVAALVGVHSGGDLTIEHVAVDGAIYGEESTRAVAGLATVGGNGADIGDLLVTANTNLAVVGGLTIESNEDGGNVAQIVAGTTWGTKFLGTVIASGNVADGACVVDWRNPDDEIALPECNLAPAVIQYTVMDGFTEDDGVFRYRRFVEANDPDTKPIDPVKRTARMLAGFMPNGSVDEMGMLTDAITGSEPGGTITLLKKPADIECWGTVEIDRDITIDLGGNELFCVYDCAMFWIGANSTLTLKSGTLNHAKGYATFSGPGKSDTRDITDLEQPENFEERTIAKVNNLSLSSQRIVLTVSNSSVDHSYVLEFKPSLTAGWECLGTAVPGTGGDLSLETVPDPEYASGFFRVRER